MELSAADRRLLRALQEDARMTNQALAEAAGLSTSACWRRVRTLEEAGVIRAYRAHLDAEAAGLTFHAVVQVSLERHEGRHVKDFITAVASRPEVLECFATTGEADYHLRVVCADKEAYNSFLERFLFTQPGVAQVRTNLVLKEIKQTAAVPV